MPARPEIRELAGALRRHADRATERRGRGRYEAIVLATSPLRLDVAGLDFELDEDDVTIGGALAAHLAVAPLAKDDALVLIETDDGDYDAVEVLRD